MSPPSRSAASLLRPLVRPNRRAFLPAIGLSRAAISAASTAPPQRWHSTSSSTSASSSSSSNFSSVNAQEVSHFNDLAADWWEPHGSSRLLHLMNPLRHDFIRACHRTHPDDPPPENSHTSTLAAEEESLPRVPPDAPAPAKSQPSTQRPKSSPWPRPTPAKTPR